MAMRSVSVALELPDDLVASPEQEARLVRRVQEAVVLDLLRHGHLSRGKAAEMLDLDTEALMDRMSDASMPVLDLDEDDGFDDALAVARSALAP